MDDLRRYHELAIAPYWSRIQEHLEGDTLMRGQALALGGVEALASTLALVAACQTGVPWVRCSSRSASSKISLALVWRAPAASSISSRSLPSPSPTFARGTLTLRLTGPPRR